MNTLPKRINHQKHNHPDNSYQRGRCRTIMERTGKPLDVDNPPSRKRREPSAGVTRTAQTTEEQAQVDRVQEQHQRKTVQRRRMTLSEIRVLGEGLDAVAETLAQYAQVDRATVDLVIEGHKVQAIYEGATFDWTIESV